VRPAGRLLVFGVDGDGGSCLVEARDIVARDVPAAAGTAMAQLFSIDRSPPPPCPPGAGTPVAGRPPGHVDWHLVELAPLDESLASGPGTELHHRSAYDLVVILDGSGDYLLADGEHPVNTGDCIVMPGSDHGFRQGPDGCRMVSFEIGASSA
jgi:mannose-6-phosphate isomerase-like protein (cupin superfamily)